jgi:FkbM family methyltransferase
LQTARLDYEGAKLIMDAETEPEIGFRLHAVQKEPWTRDFIESIPEGGIFYDVGANVGPYTLIAASRGVPTVAIEPSFSNYGALCRNLMRNNLMEMVAVIPMALGDVQGVAWFDYQDVRPGGASHVLGSDKKLFWHRQQMLVIPLDALIESFHLTHPTHIKIDVDGGEFAVLKGAEKTLRDERTRALMVEMPLETEKPIADALGSIGYRVRERFAEREGKPIANIAYGWFER